MSHKYYEIEELVKEKYKETFSTVEGRRYLFLATFGWFICSAVIIMLIGFKDFVDSVAIDGNLKVAIIILLFLLGITITVNAIRKAIKLGKGLDVEGHIVEVTTSIKGKGLDTIEKIDNLKKEIKDENDRLEKKISTSITLLTSFLKTLFLVPIGFFLSMFFSKDSEIAFDDVLNIGVILLIITMLVLGLAFIFYAVFKDVVFPTRRKRERVLQYLNDTLYSIGTSETNGEQ